MKKELSIQRSTDSTPVLRALEVMRSQTAGEPLTLKDLADAAYVSPYHFLRTFRRATGLPPGRFLAALRLKAAVRLLLTTDLPVTDVCFESGYNSLGTFTRRFTEVMGLPPGRLRLGASQSEERRCADEPPPRAGSGGTTVRGHLFAGEEVEGTTARLYFVGLFTANYPQGAPVACSLLEEPGPFALCPVPDGTFHLLAAAISDPDALWESFLGDHPDLLAGSLQTPIEVMQGRATGPTDLTLRRPQPTDPPLLACLPLLLGHRRALIVSRESSILSNRGEAEP
jgi:AraC-like DNA-binding protein